MGLQILTASGGLIEISNVRDRFHGDLLLLHVDQTANIDNGEGDASIVITEQEVKNLISLLNSFLMSKNGGVPFVVLYEPLSYPAVKIQIDFMEYLKNHADGENKEKN
jgi:hypothetical protein